jgi:hypothetical protein
VDFRLYARVLWRFKVIVALGLVLGLSAGALSLVRVSTDGFTYRQPELWSSTTRLGVTQNGFPWGRLFAQSPLPEDQTTTTGQEGTAGEIPIADPNRFNSLAVLYAELATSDPVLGLMRRNGPIPGKVIAVALRDSESGTMLPLIDLTAISTSPEGAVELAVRSSKALDTYVQEQQQANEVPSSDRVLVQVVVRPKAAEIFQPRPKTMPVVVFFVVMLATIGLVFLLESLRPRLRQPAGPAAAELQSAERRRTA